MPVEWKSFTRPSMALYGLFIASLYALFSVILLEVEPAGTVLGVFMSPCLTYMTLREVGKWKGKEV